jgi:hypothetical protein
MSEDTTSKEKKQGRLSGIQWLPAGPLTCNVPKTYCHSKEF